MCIYKIAKRIVDSREKSKENYLEKYRNQEEIRRKEWEDFISLIQTFAKQYIDDLEKEYVKYHKPKFKEGQKVLLHPYYKGDGWEPTGYALFDHTPFDGPVEVIIDKIHLDSARAYEEIMEAAQHRDYFNRITGSYDDFKKRADNLIGSRLKDYQEVMHYYSFHLPNSDRQYWRYAIREDKFFLPNSKGGKAVKKIASLKKKRKELKEEINRVQNEYRELYNLIGY